MEKKYKEPVVQDTANLPDLPEGWAWTVLENVAEVVDPHASHYLFMSSPAMDVVKTLELLQRPPNEQFDRQLEMLKATRL